ncbi:MAG: hypothetical protein SA378_01305 [Sedimentibacter sp.]|uniref:anti-sigma-I factor RsgI family protein n=1 Tax=Sedimentibacter sp. TaxID=1960295 RepID=UPI002981CD94|nr:hypothetical protein [Sedimentibacter sp.]MDW5298769.1 hypothetical protein [Sedimentibacter sp.]
MNKLFVFMMKFVIAICIFTVIFVASAYIGYLYITPTSYISLKGTPSVEFTVNAFDRVIDIEADSEMGEIINDLELKNRNISNAVQTTVNELVSEGYISQNNNSSLIISVSNTDVNKANKMMKKLHDEIKINLDGTDEIQMVKVETIIIK